MIVLLSVQNNFQISKFKTNIVFTETGFVVRFNLNLYSIHAPTPPTSICTEAPYKKFDVYTVV